MEGRRQGVNYQGLAKGETASKLWRFPIPKLAAGVIPGWEFSETV
jgi:hypothetical protein